MYPYQSRGGTSATFEVTGKQHKKIESIILNIDEDILGLVTFWLQFGIIRFKKIPKSI